MISKHLKNQHSDEIWPAGLEPPAGARNRRKTTLKIRLNLPFQIQIPLILSPHNIEPTTGSIFIPDHIIIYNLKETVLNSYFLDIQDMRGTYAEKTKVYSQWRSWNYPCSFFTGSHLFHQCNFIFFKGELYQENRYE